MDSWKQNVVRTIVCGVAVFGLGVAGAQGAVMDDFNVDDTNLNDGTGNTSWYHPSTASSPGWQTTGGAMQMAAGGFSQISSRDSVATPGAGETVVWQMQVTGVPAASSGTQLRIGIVGDAALPAGNIGSALENYPSLVILNTSGGSRQLYNYNGDGSGAFSNPGMANLSYDSININGGGTVSYRLEMDQTNVRVYANLGTTFPDGTGTALLDIAHGHDLNNWDAVYGYIGGIASSTNPIEFDNFSLELIPEPASAALLAMGLGTLLIRRKQ